MLNIKNLFVNFAARPVLKNINLEVEKGETLARKFGRMGRVTLDEELRNPS